MMNRIRLFVCLALTAAALPMSGQGIVTGTVADQTDQEALAGVNISNEEGLRGTTTGPDGRFSLEIESGRQRIRIGMVGYSAEYRDVVAEDGGTISLGRIMLSPEVIGLGEITVIASLAVERRSPLTVSTIRAEAVESRLGDEPLPEIMKNVPGVYASRTGGGSGDAAINIRGFKQENISMLLNGIPISSVENGLVYWNNWLGLAEATERIQVQRGLGASPAAMNSVGGTVNIITQTTGAEKGGSMGFSTTSYGNNHFSFSYNSGKLANGMAVTMLGSHTRGPGYIDATYVDAWGYFLSVSKEFNRKHKLVFVGLGSPEKHGQRNFMLTKKETDRHGLRFNKDWGSYNGQINNASENFYHKPHLSLSHYWEIGPRTFMATAAYFSYGYGGGKWSDSFMAEKSIWDYRNPSGQIDWGAIYDNNSSHTDTFTLATGETVSGFSKNIQTNFLASHVWTGIMATIDQQIGDRLKVSTGIHYRYFRSTLRQKVRDLLGGDFFIDDYAWSLAGVAGREQIKYPGDIIKIDNGALIHYLNMFSQAEYSSGRWNAFLAGSVSGNRYRRADHYNYPGDPWSEIVNLAGFDVKGGINHNITDIHHLYANAGYFSRVPYYKFVFGNFTNTVAEDLANEKITSFEAGYGLSRENTRIRLNAYYTYWKDKSFLANEYNQFLEPALVSGLDARHLGIEMEAEQRIGNNISLGGLFSVGDWKWQNDVTAVVYDNNNVLKDTIGVYANGLYVGDAPQTQLGLHGRYRFMEHFSLYLNWIYYDRLYADFNPVNRSDPDDREQSYRIPAYQLLDAHLQVYFTMFGKEANFMLSIFNLLDSKHIIRGRDGQGHRQDSFTGFWGFGRTLSAGFKIRF
jgi:iron complex outermembrane recepter protein